MGDIPAVPHASPPANAAGETRPYDAPDRPLMRSVAAAVQTLNAAGFAGEGREVTFSFDHGTRQPVVRIVETSTHEVVAQWPPEYILRLAAEQRNKREIQDESLF